jgi:hypothetical protein
MPGIKSLFGYFCSVECQEIKEDQSMDPLDELDLEDETQPEGN